MGDTQGEKVYQKMEKIRAESSAMTIGNSLSSAGTLMVELLLRTTWHFNHADKPSSLFFQKLLLGTRIVRSAR